MPQTWHTRGKKVVQLHSYESKQECLFSIKWVKPYQANKYPTIIAVLLDRDCWFGSLQVRKQELNCYVMPLTMYYVPLRICSNRYAQITDVECE